MSDPQILPAKDGWFPSDALIGEVKAAAKAKGLICDWPTICALANHDLLLDCTHITGEFGADLIAKLRDGKWTFVTDGEEMRERIER